MINKSNAKQDVCVDRPDVFLSPLQITVKLVTEGMDAAPVCVPVEGVCGSVWNVRWQKGQMLHMWHTTMEPNNNINNNNNFCVGICSRIINRCMLIL